MSNREYMLETTLKEIIEHFENMPILTEDETALLESVKYAINN